LLRWQPRQRIELAKRSLLPGFVRADGDLDQGRGYFGKRMNDRSQCLRLRAVQSMQRIDIKPKASAGGISI